MEYEKSQTYITQQVNELERGNTIVVFDIFKPQIDKEIERRKMCVEILPTIILNKNMINAIVLNNVSV